MTKTKIELAEDVQNAIKYSNLKCSDKLKEKIFNLDGDDMVKYSKELPANKILSIKKITEKNILNDEKKRILHK